MNLGKKNQKVQGENEKLFKENEERKRKI